MFFKRIGFVCFAAIGVALVLATAAPADLPPVTTGMELLLQANDGVVFDPNFPDRVRTWQDQ